VIEAGLNALLAGNAALASLVGGRVFQGAAPDDLAQYPCVAWSFVGGSGDPTFQSVGVIRQRVEINAFAALAANGNSPATVASQIRAAVIAAVLGWKQVLGDGTSVLDAELLNPGTDMETADRIYRRLCEFYVLYTLNNL
jgi:hypothetical protein